MNETIKPPRRIPGMEKPLPDYSERLARRTGKSAAVVAARLRKESNDDEQNSNSFRF